MADIKELAISYWRMNKWLINANVERKMAASSALRSIKKYLDANGVEVLDLTGQKFDSGLAVDVINNDIPEGANDENALISEMIKPIIMQNGSVIQFGQVSVGLTVKKQAKNNPVKEVAENQNANYKIILDEIKQLAEKIHQKPNDKSKIIIPSLSALLALLMILNIIMSISYNKSLSKTVNENVSQIRAEEVSEDDIENIMKDLEAIKNSNESQSNRIEELISKYNNQSKDEIKFVKYTVQKGDSIYMICQNNKIDFNSNIALIQSINNLENIGRIYAGQVLILPIANMEEN